MMLTSSGNLLSSISQATTDLVAENAAITPTRKIKTMNLAFFRKKSAPSLMILPPENRPDSESNLAAFLLQSWWSHE